jgi:tetratricopeptide (TPR) repeat protein
VRVAILAVALWAASGPIFAVYDAATAGHRIGPELDRAVRAMFLAAAGAGLAVLAVSLVESRIRLGERGVRVARLSGVALLAVLVLGVGVVGVAKSEGISNTVHDQWNAMLHPGGAFPGEDQSSQESSGSRLLSTNPVQRYDYWRVALDGFRDHPVAGLGAGGFDDRYEADRRYPKHSAYPHNVALRALSELGLLGGLLTLAFVAAVGWGLLRGLAGSSPGERGLVAAGVAAAAYFLVHGEFDWIEAFPVMMGPALALPLVALIARERPSGAGGLQRPRLRGPVIGLVALAAVAAAVSFALPWLAVRYRERAVQTWRANAPAAFADLDRAARLDRLNAAPLLVEGSIALQLGDDARAVASFEEAARREPSWLAHFELGLIAGARGDKRAAMRQLEAAKRLNPPEPAISAAQAVIRRGRNVDPVGLSRRLFESPLFNLRRLT